MDTNTTTIIYIVLSVNVATLLAVLTFGYKVMRYINFQEFRVNILWADWKERTGKAHTHRRALDA